MQEGNNIQNRFATFGAVPSDKVWTGIESALDNKKRKPFFWWWVIGVIGIAGFSFATIASFNTNTKEVTHSVIKTNVVEAPTQNNMVVQRKTHGQNSIPVSKVSKGQNTIPKKDKTILSPLFKKTNPKKFGKKKSVFHPTGNGINENLHVNNTPADDARSSISKLDFRLPSLLPSSTPKLNQFLLKANESKWSFGLQYGYFSTTKSLETFFANQITDTTNEVLSNASVYSEARNINPLQISLLAEYTRNQNMSFLFGFGYSRFTYQEFLPYKTEANKEFRFHTLDFPLQMNYNIVSKKKIRLYFGIGLVNSIYLPHDSYANTLHYLGRVSGSFGTRINLTPKIAINIEPCLQIGVVDTRNANYKSTRFYGGKIGLFYTPQFQSK